MHNEGKSYNEISRLLKIGKSTVAKMISPTYQKTNAAVGRPSLIGTKEKKVVVEAVRRIKKNKKKLQPKK